MAELVPLRSHVARALAVFRLHDRHPFLDPKTVTLETDELARIVRDRPDRFQPQVEQDLRSDSVIAEVGLESELLVGLDGIGAAVLKLVRLELVEQSDPATFLVEIDDDPAAFGVDHWHRRLEMPAAVATERVKDVAR